MNGKYRTRFEVGTVALLSGLLLGLVVVFVSANSGATVTFTFSAASSSLQVNVVSPVGIGSFQVIMEIPTEITIGTSTETGFMSSATPLPNPPQYRWFRLAANGQSSGGLNLPLTAPSGSYTMNLTAVNLKDTNGNTITLDTLLPINLEIPPSSSQSSSTTQIGTTSVVDTTTASNSSLLSLTSASTANVLSVGTTNMTSIVTSSSESSPTTQIQATSIPEFPRSMTALLILPLLLVIVSRTVLDQRGSRMPPKKLVEAEGPVAPVSPTGGFKFERILFL